MPWAIEFFEDESGRQPTREWIVSLDVEKRSAVLAAIELHLGTLGIGVCATEHGKQLGGGVFELRVRLTDNAQLRVFCHAYGDKKILLLGGYDKGLASSARRQAREIETARKRLREFTLRRQRLKAGNRRRR